MENKDISFVTEKRKIILTGGGELDCLITLPKSEKLKGLNKFYAKVCENCIKFCENELSPSFASSSHFYRYRIRSQAIQERERLTVLIKVSLTDRNSARVVDHSETSHVWRYGLLVKSRKDKM